jgi:hypothetical protein
MPLPGGCYCAHLMQVLLLQLQSLQLLLHHYHCHR